MTTKPTPINPEAITAEAQTAAWMHDTILQACPYPFGSLAAQVFTDAFNAAKQNMADACAPQPKVQEIFAKHDLCGVVSYGIELAQEITTICRDDPVQALATVRAAGLESDQQIALSNMLDSKTRSALKKAKELATA